MPLSHHRLDATHITASVVTAGLTRGAWSLAASGFHGREPDEHRTDLDFGAIDLWSAKLQ